MADNTTLNAGSGGDVIATDDVAGVKYQRVKLTDGTADSTTAIVAGGGVEAAALRVTIASDSTGVVSVDDNGGSLTVDGTVAATQSGTWTVQPGNTANTTPWLASIHDGTTKASVADLTNSNPLHVAIVDSNGDQVTSFGGGTQYTEDAAAAANPVGNMLIVVREDARAGSLTTTDGDNVALRGNNSGELYVKHTDSIAVTNSGTFAVQAALTAGTNTNEVVGDAAHDAAAAGNPLLQGAYASAAAPTDVSADGDAVRVWALRNGSQVVNIAAAGALVGATSNALDVNIKSPSAIPVTDNSGSLTVDNSGTFAVQATVAAAATNIAKAEDVASADADVGVPAMAVRKATPANTSGTDGDYEMLQMSAGRLWVDASGVSLTVANAGTFAVQDGPSTSGGLSYSAFVGAASNNKTQAKGSAGQLYFISVQNLAATPVYLKVFDKTSANVTAGTTACDYQFMIPGNTAGAGVVLNVDKGIAHANGITVMLTAGIATTDNTSVSANNQVVTIGYK